MRLDAPNPMVRAATAFDEAILGAYLGVGSRQGALRKAEQLTTGRQHGRAARLPEAQTSMDRQYGRQPKMQSERGEYSGIT